MHPLGTVRRLPHRLLAARLAALLIVLAASFAACRSSTTGVGDAFAASATSVCAHALDLKRAEGPFPLPNFNPTKPDPAKLAEVAVFLHLTDATFTTWLTEMQALGTPPSGQGPWADLVAAVMRHRDINRDQIAAAERGDTATFTADYHAGVETQAKLLAAANAAGVPDCAKVDR